MTHREHPHPALEDRARFREGAEGLGEARLDAFEEIEHDRDVVHVYMIDGLEQRRIDRGCEENCSGLHGRRDQDTRRRARSGRLAK